MTIRIWTNSCTSHYIRRGMSISWYLTSMCLIFF